MPQGYNSTVLKGREGELDTDNTWRDADSKRHGVLVNPKKKVKKSRKRRLKSPVSPDINYKMNKGGLTPGDNEYSTHTGKPTAPFNASKEFYMPAKHLLNLLEMTDPPKLPAGRKVTPEEQAKIDKMKARKRPPPVIKDKRKDSRRAEKVENEHPIDTMDRGVGISKRKGDRRK